MIKSISFIALTHFFHFNEQVTYFFKLNKQYFFTVYNMVSDDYN